MLIFNINATNEVKLLKRTSKYLRQGEIEFHSTVVIIPFISLLGIFMSLLAHKLVSCAHMLFENTTQIVSIFF